MTGFSSIASQLEEREQQQRYRRRRVLDSGQGRILQLDGRTLLNFCSNDYLGLAADPRVVQALRDGALNWGAGSGAAHLVCGHTAAHRDLEAALAEFTGRPRTLLFASGYAANTGAIAALAGRGDHLFQDRLNHASLLDGGLLSRATVHRYQHRDLGSLAQHLDRCRDSTRRKLIVTDGTFSMDGTCCDVTGLAAIARNHGAWLMIDEAHSLGVLGPEGRGLVAADQHDTDSVQVVTGTLGKAFGTHGGFIAGSEELIETLIQFARPYLYSTALPAALAVATLTSLRLACEETWRRQRLQELVDRFRNGARTAGLQLSESQTPIQPVLLGSEAQAMAWSAHLETLGVLVTAIRPPTVPAGTSRLRLTLTAGHSRQDVDQLLQALSQTQALHG